MINLDDNDAVKKLDPSDMLGLVEGLPEQFEEARKITAKFALEPGYLGKKKPDKIVVTGLGGSAIGGDLLRTYLLKELKIPVLVNRYYHLPEFVGKDTLLLAVSYSGNTEETISAYNMAKGSKARVIVMTSGGQLFGATLQTCFITISSISCRLAVGFILKSALAFSLPPPLAMM